MQRLHFNLFFLVSLIAVLVQGCVTMPSDVVMPQWDTDLNVPFATKSYTLNDIIKSQNYISISKAQDSVYLITSDEYKQTVGVSDFITVKSPGSTQTTPLLTNGNELEVLLPFPEGAELDSAVFTKGSIQITGHNPSATTACTLTIRIPGIRKPDGTLLTLTLVVNPNSSNSLTYQLANCTYKEPATQFFMGFDLAAKATGPTGGSMTFEASASDFIFSSVTGYLPPKSLGKTQSSSFSLNLGDASKYRDKVFLKTATLTMQGQYKSPAANPFVVKVNNFKVQGKRNSSGAIMNLTFNVAGADSFRFNAAGAFNQTYTESNSNITSFITFLPDSIIVSADYVMNPDNSHTYHTATDSDVVNFTTDFSSKSYLAVKQTSFVDTLKLDITQDVRDQILKGQGVTATGEIQNAIPLAAWVKVTLTDAKYKPLFVITKDNTTHADSISFSGAGVDGNGNVTTPGLSTTSVTLDSTQIRLLAQSAYYAFVSVTVSTSGANNAPVLVRAKDWIKLNVYGHVNYRIKGGN